MDFDQILEEIGEFGRYQKTNYLLICLPVMFAAANSLSYVFTTGTPAYRWAVMKNLPIYAKLSDTYTYTILYIHILLYIHVITDIYLNFFINLKIFDQTLNSQTCKRITEQKL